MPRFEQRDVSFDVPRHWEDRTVVAFAAPPGPGQAVAANLVMTRDELRPGDTLASYADRQLAELARRLDEFALGERSTLTLGGATAVSIRFTSRGTTGPLVQRLVVAEPRRGRIVCFTATTPRADQAQNDPLFDRMLASVRFGEPEGA